MFQFIMYKDSKILKSETLLQSFSIMKSSILIGEEEPAFAWLLTWQARSSAFTC